MYFKIMDCVYVTLVRKCTQSARYTKPMLVQCWTDTMLFGGTHHQPWYCLSKTGITNWKWIVLWSWDGQTVPNVDREWLYRYLNPCGARPTILLGLGGGPRVVVSTAAFHARVRGSVPGLGGLKETQLFLPHPRVKVSIEGSLRDREVACSASDRQGSNFESCVWRTVSSHHPQEDLLAQFSLYVHKGGLKSDSFHFYS